MSDWPWAKLLGHANREPTAAALTTSVRTLSRVELVDAVHSMVTSGRLPDAATHGTLAAVLIGQLSRQARGESTMTVSTSGTTGEPRALHRTVDSWAASLPTLAELTGLDSDDVLWAPGGASSTLSQYAMWLGLWAGVPVVAPGGWPASGKVSSDAPAANLGTAADVDAALQRVSVVHTVPTVLRRIVAARAQGRFPALRTAVVAGEPLRPALREQAQGNGVRVIEYYGSAELSFVAIDLDGTGLRPFPGVEVRVEHDRMLVRSSLVADGVDGPEGWATAPDRARWAAPTCPTSDPGHPARPRIQLLGRPDCATVGGTTVHLAEVDAVLSETIANAMVRAGAAGEVEAVAVAMPHPVLGERVEVLVSTGPVNDTQSAKAKAAALQTAIRSAIQVAAVGLSAPARPARVVIQADPMPHTDAGKIDRVRAQRLLAHRRAAS